MCPAILNYNLTISIWWNFWYITVILSNCWVISLNIRFFHGWLYDDVDDDDDDDDDDDEDDDDDNVQGNIFINGLSRSHNLNVMLSEKWSFTFIKKVIFKYYYKVLRNHQDVWLQYQKT